MLILPIDIIKKSIAIYKAHGDLFARYIKLIYIPVAAIIIITTVLEQAPLNASVTLPIIAISGITFSLISFWMTLALFRMIAACYEGREGGMPKKNMEETLPLLWKAVIVSFLNALAVLGGTILFIIPGIIFSIWFSFSVLAVILDNKNGVSALSYSKSLVKGRWWPVLARIFVPSVIFGALVILTQAIVNLPANAILQSMAKGTIPYMVMTVVPALFSAAIATLLAPLQTAAQTILYIELKKTPVSSPSAHQGGQSS